MLKLVAVSAVLATSVNAFWRMECPGRVGVARVDPIVNFGEASVHAHSLHGSSGISETSGTDELLKGDCTSCRVTEDKSAYWHPAFYFQDASTGKYEIVNQVGGMLAYYLLYGDNITAFPHNFRMLSGDTNRRTYTVGDPSQPDPDKSSWASLGQTKQSDLAQRAIGFNCLNYAKPPEGTLYRHELPTKEYLDANCEDGVRFELMFPSCWKGGDATDSDNHKDHVAFPDLVMTGNCPKDYPVRLPSLMYETIWDTHAFKNRKGKFVFSNGDEQGFGYHGDFIMGWEEDVLQSAVNDCTNPSGLIQDCSHFTVVDEGTATQCKMNTPKILAAENVIGPMLELPGDVKITVGNGDGGDTPKPQSPKPSQSSKPSTPALSYKPGEKPSDAAQPLPGQVFKETSAAAKSSMAIQALAVKPTSTPAPAPAPVPTPAPAPPPPAAPPAAAAVEDEASYYSTQYVTNGHIVSKVLWAEKFVTVTETVDATTTVPAPSAPPAKRARRGAHVHRRGHRNL